VPRPTGDGEPCASLFFSSPGGLQFSQTADPLAAELRVCISQPPVSPRKCYSFSLSASGTSICYTESTVAVQEILSRTSSTFFEESNIFNFNKKY
jgi:hypothetical protein